MESRVGSVTETWRMSDVFLTRLSHGLACRVLPKSEYRMCWRYANDPPRQPAPACHPLELDPALRPRYTASGDDNTAGNCPRDNTLASIRIRPARRWPLSANRMAVAHPAVLSRGKNRDVAKWTLPSLWLNGCHVIFLPYDQLPTPRQTIHLSSSHLTNVYFI